MNKYPFTISKRRKNKHGIQVWQIRFQYNLKSYDFTVNGSKPDAVKKGIALYQDVINGLMSDPSNATFKQYWADTFTNHHISRCDHSTRVEYQGNFRRYFAAYLHFLYIPFCNLCFPKIIFNKIIIS